MSKELDAMMSMYDRGVLDGVTMAKTSLQAAIDENLVPDDIFPGYSLAIECLNGMEESARHKMLGGLKDLK